MQDLLNMDGLGEPCEDAKASFWKKNNRAVPGRPSPKTSQRAAPVKNRAAGSTSFQDFQESISDAWDMGDDEFCIISGMSDTKISKRVSDRAALSVINTHRSSSAHINNSTNNSSPALAVQSDNITDCSQILPSTEKAFNFNSTSPIASQLDSTSELKKLDNNEGSNNPVKLSTQFVSRPHIPHAYPGRPQPMRCSVLPLRDTTDSEAKLERFTPLLESNLLNLSDLRHLSWSGIPVKIRAITWRLLAGYLPASLERREALLERKRLDYWNLVEQYYDTERDEAYQDTYRQIHIDIPRMNPLVALFQQATVQEMFERILFIWAIRHPASGYVQGINDLVTPFFMVFLQEAVPIGENLDNFIVDILPKEKRDIIEADSFWCLSKFLDCIQDNYIFAQLGIQTKVNQLKELIQRIDGPLHKHLQSHGVDYLQFSFRWMNNLLTRELPLHCTIRLWDTYLAESDGFAAFQLYVCAAFLLHWRAQLMQERDFQGLMIMLQNLPTQNWTDSQIGILVAEAYRLKFTFADAPNHLQRGVVTGDR